MTLQEVLKELEALADPEIIAMKAKRFGIVSHHALGITLKDVKALAKRIGTNDELALALFDTGIYEARLLCSKLCTPSAITEALMEKWVQSFENWEICDSFCMGFFVKSRFAIPKVMEWSKRVPEFEKRAAFAMMAAYSFAHKKAENEVFEQFFPIIIREANDDRIYVKKAVNWALRNIGKRNVDLHQGAIEVAEEILALDTRAAKWIAKDALRQLTKPNVNILDYPRSMYRKHG